MRGSRRLDLLCALRAIAFRLVADVDPSASLGMTWQVCAVLRDANLLLLPLQMGATFS
jgi:hypothetical protein